MGQKTVIAAIILIIITFILAVIFVISRIIGGVGGGEEQKEEKEITTTPVANIVKDQFVYDGLSLEIEADISDWVTKNSFTVTAGGTGGLLGGSSRSLYVVFDSPFSLPHQTSGENELGLGELVRVNIKGRALILNREEVERALGISLDDEKLALDDSRINGWKFGIIFIADSVEKLE